VPLPLETPAPSERKRCFAPVADERSRVLILGSLPGDKSLSVGQYYGNRQNQFWELCGTVLGIDLRSLDYDARLAALLVHGIGLWDVIAEAERPGSLDTAISGATSNALAELVDALPQLRAIGFNGGTAARLGRRQIADTHAHLALLDLPSSSPAHTIGFLPKLQVWRHLAGYLAPPPGREC
jgi:TDG/mug DNA glycosylase family protein